jgi:magnesium chelatase family protein
MAKPGFMRQEKALADLLRRDNTLNGGILFGIDGHVIEIQARAVAVLKKPKSWREVCSIAGMVYGAMQECMSRISLVPKVSLGTHFLEALSV